MKYKIAKMLGSCTYFCQVILILMTSSQIKGEPSIHRVVYHTFALQGHDSPVHCYGTCVKNTKDLSEREFEQERCEGTQLRLSCGEPKQTIRVLTASVGRLTEEDLCKKQNLLCSKNITNDVEEKCGDNNDCKFKIPKHYFDETHCNIRNIVKYLSIDITFLCENLTETTVVGTMDPQEKTTTELPPSSSPYVIDRTTGYGTPYTNPLPTPFPSFDKQENKSHMALAIILSIFIGLVISLFFILDHSRRRKRKKKVELKGNDDSEDDDTLDTVSNGNLYNTLQMKPLTKPLNGCLKKPKELQVELCIEVDEESNCESESESEDDDDKQPLFMKNHLVMDETSLKEETMEIPPLPLEFIDKMERNHSPQNSLANLPPPPKELLENNSPILSPSELIPPPLEFVGKEKMIPSFVVTSPTPTNSCSSNLTLSNKNVHSNQESKKRVTRPCLKQSTAFSTPNLTSEKKVRYPSSIISIQDSPIEMEDEPPDFILAKQMDSPMNRSVSIDVVSKSSSLVKPKRNESPLFQMRLDNQDNNNHTVGNTNKNLRKGKLHVISTASRTDLVPLCQDDELTVGMIDEPTECNLNDPGIDNFIIENDQIDKERLISIEESGYQSRETGTDSLCSSNRSTDYEDFHVFSPTSIPGGILKSNSGRPKSSRPRERTSKRECAVANVKVLTKVARRMRYENTRTQISELQPSESSMEDTSSRDSVKIPRTRLKSKRRDLQSGIDGTKRFSDHVIRNDLQSSSDIEKARLVEEVTE